MIRSCCEACLRSIYDYFLPPPKIEAPKEVVAPPAPEQTPLLPKSKPHSPEIVNLNAMMMASAGRKKDPSPTDWVKVGSDQEDDG